jgi:hypothetical protein
LFDREEWEDRSFEPRLLAILELLTAAKDFEKEHQIDMPLLQFRANARETELVYGYNPFQNDPPIPEYYVRQFLSEILPGLIRRFTYCPKAQCEIGTQARVSPNPSVEDDQLADSFAAGLALCAVCGDERETCLLTHPDRQSFDTGSGFFDHIIEISASAALSTLETPVVFPDPGDEATRSLHLMAALRIRKAELSRSDPNWNAFPLRPIRYSDAFWNEIRNADWMGNEIRYQRQLIDSLLQVSAGRSTSSNLHRMTGQTITIDGQSKAKWNAYVFQSGATALDRRCSRIYYANTETGVYVNEFNIDAH